MTDTAYWDSEPGAALTGTVVEIFDALSKYKVDEYGNPATYPVVVIEGQTPDPETGAPTIAIHCQRTVLENEMRKAAPDPGDQITITYLGSVLDDRSGDVRYHRYSVRNLTSPPRYDWGTGPGAPQEPIPRAGPGPAPAGRAPDRGHRPGPNPAQPQSTGFPAQSDEPPWPTDDEAPF